MNKQEKEAVVTSLEHEFSKSKGLFLVHYRGMTVAQLQDLRKSVRQNEGHVRVAKVRLIKRALKNVSGADALESLLKEQIALIFVDKEAPAVAKIIYNFAQEGTSLKIIGGFVDSQSLSAEAVGRFATLPSREALLAQVCGTIQAPLSRFVGLLSMMPTRFVNAIKQIEQQKK